MHALPSQLGAAARFGVEMVLPLSAHHELAVLGNLEALSEGFICFHIKDANLRMSTNATKKYE